MNALRVLPGHAVWRTRIALWLICSIACALFAAAAIRFYFGPAMSQSLNSDSAVPVLLADEMLRKASPLPASWYFANDEIWTLSPQVFALPFVAALGITPLALKLGNLCCLGVMLVFIALPLHRITGSWAYSISIAAGVLAMYSGFQQQAIYSQVAYGWFCAQFALLMYLAQRMRDEVGPAPWRIIRLVPWTGGLYVLFLVNVVVDSPLRALVYWVAPVILVSLVSAFPRRGARVLVATTVFAFLAGALAHFVLSKHLLTQAGTTAAFLKPPGEWIANAAMFTKGIPTLIGYAGNGSTTLFGTTGFIRAGFFVIGAVVVAFAPTDPGAGGEECRFFARVSFAMLLGTLAVLTIGKLVMGPESVRYLVPPVLLCLAAFMAIIWRRLDGNGYAVSAIATIFVVAFCGGGWMIASIYGSASPSGNCDAPGAICRLRALLATTGVHKGYATYWNGNVMTLASHGEITTCGVVLQPHLAPFRWLVSKDCFDRPTDDRYFIALTRAEVAGVGRDYLVSEAGKPDDIVTDGNNEIWIYTSAKSDLAWLRL